MTQLTARQATLWRLRSLGLGISEIARRLSVSRQAVHKNLQAVEAKIYRNFILTANALKIDVRKIDVKKGYLTGWSHGLKTEVRITFSTKNGVQIWFKHKGDCKNCPLREECRRMILSEAEERGIILPTDKDIEPTVLAEMFFKELEGIE